MWHSPGNFFQKMYIILSHIVPKYMTRKYFVTCFFYIRINFLRLTYYCFSLSTELITFTLKTLFWYITLILRPFFYF